MKADAFRPPAFLPGRPSRETTGGREALASRGASGASECSVPQASVRQALRGAGFQTKTGSCSMPHLHVQAVEPGSGFRARSRASRGLLACVSGFSIENTPTSPGLRRLATGPVPVSPCGTLALHGPAGRDQARCRAEGGCGRGASGLDASGLHCCSEQPLPAERPAGAATSHQPWPACVPGAGRGREAPRGPGLGRGLDSRGASQCEKRFPARLDVSSTRPGSCRVRAAPPRRWELSAGAPWGSGRVPRHGHTLRGTRPGARGPGEAPACCLLHCRGSFSGSLSQRAE